MTSEQLREAAQVMLAAADGKKIERRWIAGSDLWEEKCSLNEWNFERMEYRIKPEPRKVRVRFFKDRYGYIHALSEVDSPGADWIAIGETVEIEVRD